jgi:hypothetical protein
MSGVAADGYQVTLSKSPKALISPTREHAKSMPAVASLERPLIPEASRR